MSEFKIKDSAKYFDNHSTFYRVVVTDLKQGTYVRFDVYRVDEDQIQSMIDCGEETSIGDYSFGAFVSYKHIFPHYGEEKESSGRYHIQLSELEDLKRWHDTIYNICEIMKVKYCDN